MNTGLQLCSYHGLQDLEESRGKIDSLKQIECDLKKQLSEIQETMTNSENAHLKQLQVPFYEVTKQKHQMYVG